VNAKLLIAIAVLPLTAKAELVYNNMHGPIGSWTLIQSTLPKVEVGDRVTLAGSSRDLTSVSFWLTDTVQPYADTIDVTLRVYDVNPATQMPGNLLSVGFVEDFTYDWWNYVVSAPMTPAILPDEVFVTSQITFASSDTHGVAYHVGPSIGSDDPEKWYFRNTSGEWTDQSGQGMGWGSLALSVSAVPEPATFAALALGLAALSRRKRRGATPAAADVATRLP
jgi:hypothetical protein